MDQKGQQIIINYTTISNYLKEYLESKEESGKFFFF
jgi:hypothetical protein